jgi:FkbM family methyltransferase
MKWILKTLLKFQPTRWVLNELYNLCTFEAREKLHLRYSKLFGDNDGPDSIWHVEFMGARIKMPMSNWNQAMTIAAYDSDVVRMYQYLLLHHLWRPSVFVDVGANFGTHTFLFASQNIPAVLFEPNPKCHSYIRKVRAVNYEQWNDDISSYRIALGNSFGHTNIWFPPEQTWLGIIGDTREDAMAHKIWSDPECPKLNSGTPMQSESVMVQKLDAYYGPLARRKTQDGPILIKIDTEGFEIEVMNGAEMIISNLRPLIMFECFNSTTAREEIWHFLNRHDYAIVPVSKRGMMMYEVSCSHAGFIEEKSYNFIAFPKELYQ